MSNKRPYCAPASDNQSASLKGVSYRDYFQAGKSVDGIANIEPAAAIVERFAQAASAPQAKRA